MTLTHTATPDRLSIPKEVGRLPNAALLQVTSLVDVVVELKLSGGQFLIASEPAWKVSAQYAGDGQAKLTWEEL